MFHRYHSTIFAFVMSIFMSLLPPIGSAQSRLELPDIELHVSVYQNDQSVAELESIQQVAGTGHADATRQIFDAYLTGDGVIYTPLEFSRIGVDFRIVPARLAGRHVMLALEMVDRETGEAINRDPFFARMSLTDGQTAMFTHDDHERPSRIRVELKANELGS